MFSICSDLLDPDANNGRFVTTAIHFGNVQIDPKDMLRSPHQFRRGSNEHHYALLVHSFGGFYPSVSQLERCARGKFELVWEEDGTKDYYLTAEKWLQMLKQSLLSDPLFMLAVAGSVFNRPKQGWELLDCLLIAQSWNWQFRGKNTPMKLLRQCWQSVGANRSRISLV